MGEYGCVYWCPTTRRRQEMALQSVQVEARCVDLCANVQITQRYVNTTAQSVETVYVFPLDNRSAVSAFEVEIDGVVSTAMVKAKVEARQTYERAVASGASAQLLEKLRDDVFQMTVGNLKPWSTTLIRLRYITDLVIEGDATKFFLPTAVAPRYTPINSEFVPSSDSRAAPDGLQFDIVAAMSSNVISIECQTSGVALAVAVPDKDPKIRTAKLEGVMSLSKDLIILIKTKEPHVPRCLVEHDPVRNTYAGVVTLAPHIDFDDIKAELVFVVDRSGSMRGEKIIQAQKSLRLFFRSLPEDCYFNIVGFGSRHELLFPSSVKYSAKSLQTALHHVENLDADLGGTELREPLRRVLSHEPIFGYTRQVFVLTDGQVSNTADTIEVVRSAVRTPESRVFSIGLGHGASHALVEGLAEAGRGTSNFCIGDSNLREMVISQLRHAIQPALTDVTIEWEGATGAPPSYESIDKSDVLAESSRQDLLSACAPMAGSLLDFSARTKAPPHPAGIEGFTRAPFVPPPIHTGERFLSFCLVNKGGRPPVAVRVSASSPAGPLNTRLEVNPAEIIKGNLLHTMAARAHIHDLESGQSWLHQDTRGRGGHTLQARVKSEIERLGTEHSLVTQHTSFVSIQEQLAQCHTAQVQRPMESYDRFQSLGPSARQLNSFECNMSSANYHVPSASICLAPAHKQKAGCMGAPSSPPPRRRKESWWGSSGRGTLPPPKAAVGGFFTRAESHATASDQTEKKISIDEVSTLTSFNSSDSKIPERCLERLVELQDFSGSFPLSAEFVRLVGCTLAGAAALADAYAASNEPLAATALAIVFMRSELETLKSEWILIHDKAVKWMSSVSGNYLTIIQHAETLLVAK